MYASTTLASKRCVVGGKSKINEMSSNVAKPSMQDKKDLDKFTKLLALKAAQIIVQSRTGEKVRTKCKSDSARADWFNLAVQEVPDVSAEAKRVFCGEAVASGIPLCVEISLRTVEGDSMVLETWSLGVAPERIDPTLRVTYTVYNRMGILLKSLVSVSRVTPAYKLSRRQGPDSYYLCYRIYMGEPQLATLGDNYKHAKVGQLSTFVGTLHLSVFYRTKMTISPSHASRDSIMLKSDHFHSDLSPRHARYQHGDENSKSLSDTIKLGAFVANNQVVVNEEDLPIPDVPFGSLLAPRQTWASPGAIMDSALPATTAATTATTTTTTTMTIAAAAATATTTTMTMTTTTTTMMITTTTTATTPPPSASSLTMGIATSELNAKCNSRNGSRRSSCSVTSANDDFIMVDLKTPFAATNTNSDLGAFYRECQSAPQLRAFVEETTLAEQVGDLTEQLETFETNMRRYEDVLASLCRTDNNGY